MTTTVLAPIATPQPAPAVCRACGHRSSLHGLYLRDAWCIAWDGPTQRFCGCLTFVPVRRP